MIIFRGMVLLLVICCSFADALAEKTYERLGIMSALETELRLLLDRATVHETISIGNVDYHRATLGAHEVVLVQAGGYGILPSASSSILIHELGVDAIVFTGVAGGVAKQTAVMDVVVSKDLVIHDCGTETNSGFVWKPDCGVHSDGSIPADRELKQIAVDAARRVVGDEHVFEGTIASGEAFIASEAYVRFLREKFNAYAVESEGGPVARVAYEFNIPVVVIRTLSDLADGNARRSFADFADKAADNSAKVVMEILARINLPQ